jgi:hypothetical protein
MGYAMVDLSVANAAVSTATVSLTPNGGAAIPLSYLASSSYGGYNFSFYMSNAGITYLGNTSYTMTVANAGTTVTSTLTAPGGFGFAYNSGEVSVSVADPGTVNAAILVGGLGSTSPSLLYQSTSPSGNPFTFPASDYSLSAGSTYVSLYESVGWTTTMTGSTFKGGLIAADLGMAESKH